jgi:hypothetical protein
MIWGKMSLGSKQTINVILPLKKPMNLVDIDNDLHGFLKKELYDKHIVFMPNRKWN